jgi:hypothetical protein
MPETDPQPASPEAATAADDALARAEKARDRLRDRAEWWEEHKGRALFPAMIVGLVSGYLLGTLVETPLGLGQLPRWFGAVIGLLLVGRAVSSIFDPRRLVAAQKRVDALRASRQRGR